MVEDLNPHQPAGFDQTMGEIDIVLRRRWVSTGVIVGKYERTGALEDGGFEHFPGMHQRCRLAAYGGDFVGYDPVSYIKVEDDEHLPVGRFDIQGIEIGGYVAGVLNWFGNDLVPDLFNLAFDYFDFHEESFLLEKMPGFCSLNWPHL